MKIVKNAIFALVILLAIPPIETASAQSWDYKNGWFDKNPGKYTLSNTTSLKNVLDNATGTGVNVGKSSNFLITLKEPVKIEAVYLRGIETIMVTLIQENGTERSIYAAGLEDYYVSINATIIAIRLEPSEGTASFRELEIFEKIVYDPVSIWNVTTTDYSATLTYTPVTNALRAREEIYLNGQLVNTKVFNNLQPDTTYSIKIRTIFTDGRYADTDGTFTTKPDTTPPNEVSELIAKQVTGQIQLTYKMPTNSDFTHVEIYKDDKLLQGNYKDTTFVDATPRKNEINSYVIKTVDKYGNKSAGAIAEIEHNSNEVASLKATVKDFTTVEMMWANPEKTGFEEVTIYRKDQNPGIARRVMNFFSANDGYTALFKTNGTTFTDMSVAAETEYSYKVTTTIKGSESEGKTVTVNTPKPSVLGTELTDNGDAYTINWTAPTNGKILVKVGGQDFRIVEAADLSISIPKVDMKFTIMGAPDVQLVPIDDNGNVGLATRPGGNHLGISLPEQLTASNALKGAVEIAKIVGPFLILYLAFLMAIHLIRAIKDAIFPPKKQQEKSTTRRNNTKKTTTQKGTAKGTAKGTSKRVTVKKAPARSTVKKPAAKTKAVAAERSATRQANIAKIRPTKAKVAGAVDKPVKFARSRPVDRPLRR